MRSVKPSTKQHVSQNTKTLQWWRMSKSVTKCIRKFVSMSRKDMERKECATTSLSMSAEQCPRLSTKSSLTQHVRESHLKPVPQIIVNLFLGSLFATTKL